MQVSLEDKQYLQKLQTVKEQFEAYKTTFMNNEVYWQKQLHDDPQALYKFHMLRNAMKLIYSMPKRKPSELSEQIIKKVKHVLSLGPEYPYRRRCVMICNIHGVNQHKLEKRHGMNWNKRIYRRLTYVEIEHPTLDDADVIINNFIRLKRGLLHFDSRDLVLMQWPKKQLSKEEIIVVRKYLKTVMQIIKSHVIAVCNNPADVPLEILYYINTLMKDTERDTKSFQALNERLQKVKKEWVIPDSYLQSE